ncbi:Hypothetical protein A7982_02937 [Minicystis rosea]|nr:Hypothetical protein A7982_02937 [Minicystis rosea]
MIQNGIDLLLIDLIDARRGGCPFHEELAEQRASSRWRGMRRSSS